MHKALIGIIAVCSVVLGVTYFAATAHAQRAFENPGLDLGYDNDAYDEVGCAWRGDIAPEVEEEEAPAEFYIENPPLSTEDTCRYYDGNDWKDFRGENPYGENALWPIGCFNPVNIYVPNAFLSGWIGLYGAFEFNTNYDTWDEMYYVATGAANKRKNPPLVDVAFSNSSPEKGELLTISALPIGYKSPLSKILYGWASKTPDGQFISQQGVVAGGKRITQTDPTDTLNVATCRRVTRRPIKDGTNGTGPNGMDDDWERLYSENGILTAGEDIDSDGVDLSDPEILYQENKPRLENQETPPEDEYLGIRVTPDTTATCADGCQPGDGKFVNIEEFIWGTNPLDPDTDDDGYGDEMDIVGLGQNTFTDVVDIAQRQGVADRVTYRVTTVGISDFTDENNTGHLKILIDSDEKTAIAGIKTDLEASLFNVNETPYASAVTGTSQLNDKDEIFVEASDLKSEGDRSVLDYAWFVEYRNSDGATASEKVQVPPTPEFTLQDIQQEVGRTGRFTFRHPLTELLQYIPGFDSKPGSLIYVTVEITNHKTREFSSKRIPISLGSDEAMAINITDLNTGDVMTIEDYAAKYCATVGQGDLPNPPFCVYRGRSLNEILPWIVFEGSKVEVIAQAAHVNQTDDISYQWWVNEELQTENFGQESEDNKLVIYPDAGTQVYHILVKGITKDDYRNVVFSGQIEMSVVGPLAAIVSDTVDPVAGNTVNLTGELLNFPEEYISAYNWKITKADGTETTLTGKTVTLPGGDAGAYTVELSLNFQGPDNSERVLTSEKTIVVATGSGSTVQLRKVLASMKSIVENNSMAVYQFFLVAFVVILGLLYVFGFTRRKAKKR